MVPSDICDSFLCFSHHIFSLTLSLCLSITGTLVITLVQDFLSISKSLTIPSAKSLLLHKIIYYMGSKYPAGDIFREAII